MLESELAVAMAENLHGAFADHLIRQDGQEDLCFALWTPSQGTKRLTALLHEIILPAEGDREVHGNVSFSPAYFKRVCYLAADKKCGLAFLHSHPFPGRQGMSMDDIRAEEKMAGAVHALTDLPLLGMTISLDGIWSARMWEQVEGRQYRRRWCHCVRRVGISLQVDFDDSLVPRPLHREQFKRTVTVWGKNKHADLARMRVGIVGLGSVGSMVAENLARMGLTRFTFIDFDEVKPHNLDRLLGATAADLGELKVKVAARQVKLSGTAANMEINVVPYSLADEKGYRAALDCDVLFSCVDRPRARHILNHMAYGHYIPVIDGGIKVRFKNGEFNGVDWQLQTVAPGRPCLECLGVYNPTDVSLEVRGLLDDPSYIDGLADNHWVKSNENVFPFSSNLASLEVLQFIALATGAGGIDDFGVQRFRYRPGILETNVERTCRAGCDYAANPGQGDRYFQLYDS